MRKRSEIGDFLSVEKHKVHREKWREERGERRERI